MSVIERVTTWSEVCAFDDLVPDRGACALVGPYQVALFRTSPDDAVYALSNYDPFSAACVLSRGIVGSKGDTPNVASPVYKQAFDLRTGRCLDDPDVAVAVHGARAVDGWIEVATP